MAYLERSADNRGDVRRILPSAKTVIVTATVYHTDRPLSIERASREHVRKRLRLVRVELLDAAPGQRSPQAVVGLLGERGKRRGDGRQAMGSGDNGIGVAAEGSP